MRKKSALRRILTAGYWALLLRLTVFRRGCFTHGFCRGRVSLTPGIAYRDLLSWGSYRTAAWLFFGNIIWFMPLGMLLGWKGKGLTACAYKGLLASLLIEGGQFLLGSGIFETDDLLLNMLGTMAGYCVFQLFIRIKTYAKDD